MRNIMIKKTWLLGVIVPLIIFSATASASTDILVIVNKSVGIDELEKKKSFRWNIYNIAEKG